MDAAELTSHRSTELADTACCVIVGVGSIGSRHLRLVGRLSGVTVLALPARPERRRELQEHGVEVVANWNEARERGATHAIIATSTGRHAGDATAALAAGCHVLVEKPMAPDSDVARTMAAAAQASGKGLWVGCCLRFQGALQRFREELPAIGRVHAVRIECQSYLPDWRPARPYRESYSARADEGGVLRDLTHELDYAGWLFGWPPALFARVGNSGRLGIDAEEEADLLWKNEAGTAVSIRLDYVTRTRRRQIVAVGEYGSLTWDGLRGIVIREPAGDDAAIATAVDEEPDVMYRAQAQAFLSARRDTYDTRLATASDGIRALAVCDAARRASASRREEQVRY